MRFETPKSVEDAVALLAADPQAMVLAGGTDLLVRLRARQINPSAVIDVKRIAEMTTITREADGSWRIGAAVSSAEMNEHTTLKADWPGVCEAADLIGSTQVQGRATIVGNLCNAGPAADSVPAMVAARATIRIQGPDGSRDIPVEDVPTAPGTTSLKPGELVTSVHLPARASRSGSAYLRFIPRTEMDIAVVGCGIVLQFDEADTITDACVSLGAVGPKVMLVPEAAKALIGTKGDNAALEAAAAVCSAAATPIDDKRGTVEFRKDIAGVLAKRTAKIAMSRAKGEA